jgi:hypothetical protein
MTAAACVLSYSSVNFFATDAGVPAPLARLYPLIFDAMLVVAGWAVLALGGAGFVSRLYAWLCLFIALAALAGISVVHAGGVRIAEQPLKIGATVAPFAFVLIGLGLVLALRRHARSGRQARSSLWATEVNSRVLVTQSNVTILPGPDARSSAEPDPLPTAAEGPGCASEAAGTREPGMRQNQGTELPRRSDSEPRPKIPTRRSDPPGTQSSPPWTAMTDPARITPPQSGPSGPAAEPQPTAPDGGTPPGGHPAPDTLPGERPRAFQAPDDVWRFRARLSRLERQSLGQPAAASAVTASTAADHPQADPDDASTSKVTTPGEEDM